MPRRSPRWPGALSALARQKRVRLIRNPRNLGFAASVNIGLRAAAGHDVVLLNSDTMVPPGWLDELCAVAYGAPDIGTVTPLSNDGSILSYPNQFDVSRLPSLSSHPPPPPSPPPSSSLPPSMTYPTLQPRSG